MNRLRRHSDTCPGTPVSAEVLETRALLSAGAAAVHQALSHQAAAVHDAGVTPQAGPVSALASIVLSAGGAGTLPGSFTSLKVGQSVGDKASFKFQGLLNELGGKSTAGSLSFTGKIIEVAGPAGSQTFTVTPRGGTFQLIDKTAGKVTSKFTGKVEPTPFTFTELEGHVAEVQGSYDLTVGLGSVATVDIKVSN